MLSDYDPVHASEPVGFINIVMLFMCDTVFVFCRSAPFVISQFHTQYLCTNLSL